MAATGVALAACQEPDLGPVQVPYSVNVFVERLDPVRPTKIDLLFVIDDSESMADKQALLAASIPRLLHRFTDPICVTGYPRRPTSDPRAADGCDEGQPEFPPLSDIHVGVVTSSLGAHGGTLCATQDAAGHLAGDFLAWSPTLDPNQAGSQVRVGESGCNTEAPLEALYRFLLDPDPPLELVRSDDGLTIPQGIDQVLLDQRADFLRPDSVLAIVMLSDENDASIADNGYGWFVTQPAEGSMPRSTSACDVNPNDPCCVSCLEATAPEGCTEPASDSKCQAGVFLSPEEDRLNLRAYDQKRRFGMDLLYPTSRYVDALTGEGVPNQAGELLDNPLFTSGWRPVFLVGIVGVPWQDLATSDSLGDPTRLAYLPAEDLDWTAILGDPAASPPVPPADPFMRESIEPRTGSNPRTGIAIDAPDGNSINGREYEIYDDSDLQYACIFPLPASRSGSDCATSTSVGLRPICDGTTQTHAKAYPGLRQLEVLRATNAVVASVCPKLTTGSPDDPSFGYSPALFALADRIGSHLFNDCMARNYGANEERFDCLDVLEVTPASENVPCAGHPGREEADPNLGPSIRARMAETGLCPSRSTCESFHICRIKPAGDRFDSPGYQECLESPPDTPIQNAYGYCLIDAMSDWDADGTVECDVNGGGEDCIGNPALVASCPPSMRRRLRFVSPASDTTHPPILWPGAMVFVAGHCMAFRTESE
jgi:hypothetical protein